MHFLSQLVCLPDQPPQSMLAHAESGLRVASDCNESMMKAYFLMAKAQALLLAWEVTKAHAVISEAQDLVTKLAAPSGVPSMEPPTRSDKVHLQEPRRAVTMVRFVG